MKKAYILTAIVLIAMLLAGCAQSAATPASLTVSASAAVSAPVASPSGEPWSAPLPSPGDGALIKHSEADYKDPQFNSPYGLAEPYAFVADTNLPDVQPDTESAAINVNTDSVCEDSENIYVKYESKDGLRCVAQICKKDKSKKTIVKNCRYFSLYQGGIYYITEAGEKNVIRRYDIKTGKSTTLMTSAREFYNVTGYNGKLYYTLDSGKPRNAQITLSELFTADLKGKNIKKLVRDAQEFCIYHNRAYICDSDVESAALSEYDIGAGKLKQLDQSVNRDIKTGGNRVFYQAKGCKDYDIKVGKAENYLPGDFYMLAAYGQYALFAQFEGNVPGKKIYAYDTGTGKSYMLINFAQTEQSDGHCELYTASSGVYIICKPDHKESRLYRLTINNGRAGTDFIATLN